MLVRWPSCIVSCFRSHSRAQLKADEELNGTTLSQAASLFDDDEAIPAALHPERFLKQSELHAKVLLAGDAAGLRELCTEILEQARRSLPDLRDSLGVRDSCGYTPKQRAFECCNVLRLFPGTVHTAPFVAAVRLLCAVEVFVELLLQHEARGLRRSQHTSAKRMDTTNRPYSILHPMPNDGDILRQAFDDVIIPDGCHDPVRKWPPALLVTTAAQVALGLVVQQEALNTPPERLRQHSSRERSKSQRSLTPPMFARDEPASVSAGVLEHMLTPEEGRQRQLLRDDAYAHTECLRLAHFLLATTLSADAESSAAQRASAPDDASSTGITWRVEDKSLAPKALIEILRVSPGMDKKGKTLLMAAAEAGVKAWSTDDDADYMDVSTVAVREADALIALFINACQKKDLKEELRRVHGELELNALHLAAYNGRVEACRLLVIDGNLRLHHKQYAKSPLQMAHDRRTKDVLEQLERKTGHKFAAFVSHAKQDADAAASELRKDLQRKLGQEVFFDAEHLRNLDDIKGHVKDSAVLVLLQTKMLLTRPW